MENESPAHASGNWLVVEENETAFVARWIEFLEWARDTIPGFISATLIKDSETPRHFVSIAQWDGTEAHAAWKSHAEFPKKLEACRALCEDFSGGDYELAARVS